MVRAGVSSLKLHEDWGTTPAAIDCCLSVADRFDVQVMIHTDTLNEAASSRTRSPPFRGRTIHAFHTEAPAAACAGHHQGRRPAQRAAELDQPDAPLHRQHHRRASRHADGVPSPRSRDPRGRRLRRKPHPPRDDRCRRHPARSRRALDDFVGQPGDGPRRRSDPAHLADRAQDEAPSSGNSHYPPAYCAHGRADNVRVKLRYVAKYTINPAIANGVARTRSARIEMGKLADLVIWSSRHSSA